MYTEKLPLTVRIIVNYINIKSFYSGHDDADRKI